MQTDESLQTLKMLLGIQDSQQDSLLSFLIDDVKNLINGYCHTDTLPSKLESLVPVMAADLFRRKGYGDPEPPKRIQSVSEGQRSVSYRSVSSGQWSETDDFLNEYEMRLKPFVCLKGRVPSENG